ncbi:hypothetical protein [Paenibacillus taichungensis]|uniref:hypothetical protein n=1 Tax=Paenibacillus taichungensis TaxID=484184 RepID=UPI0039A038AD
MEQYLIDEYGVIEDTKRLKNESDIEGYFKDCGRDYLDCGQGYYQETAELICKVGDKFYDVVIDAEIESARQDIGDRMYWVDRIDNVEFYEIAKPIKKKVIAYNYILELNEDQYSNLNNYLKEKRINIVDIHSK